jgi:phosphoserine phosphatase RsbU/P
MRFFPKLLILLTSIALIPFFCVISYDWMVHKNFSTEISSYAGSLLIREASGMLEHAVEAYARLVKEQADTIETIVEIQAREMERLLAETPPAKPKVYFSEDYDRGAVPGLVTVSPKYDRVGNDGRHIPGKISLNELDFELAPGVDRESVAGDIARLAAMAPVYKTLYKRHASSLVSLYTALESGVISSYPGTGGFPEDYDARITFWYTYTKKANELVWNPPCVDATGLGILAGVGMPVRWPDGSFAGVTAADVSNIQELPSILSHENWAANLQVFLVLIEAYPVTQEMGLRIIGIRDYHKELKDWKTPLQELWLDSEDKETFRQMLSEIHEGKSGTVSMPFEDRDSLWAYGLLDEGITALIFIVPMENVVAKAREMKQFIVSETYRELLMNAQSIGLSTAPTAFILREIVEGTHVSNGI